MDNDVKSQTNLVRRKQVYYFRARIPEDLRDSFEGRTERTISLRTSDKAEALQRARLERLKLDQAFHQARALRDAPAVAELSDTEVERLAALYHAKQLEDDEFIRAQGRLAGDMFELYGKAVEKFNLKDAQQVARGVPDVADSEMEAFLAGQGIKLTQGTELYRKVAYVFAKARKRAGDAVLSRQRGEVIDTPSVAPPAIRTHTQLATGDTLEVLLAYWKTQGEKRPNTLREADTAVRRFRELVGDVPASRIEKQHVVAFKDGLLAEGKAAPTVLKLLNLLRAIFETAAENGKLPANPARGVKVQRPKTKPKERVPFSLADLEGLFRSEVFTQGKRPQGGRGEAAFWIPLIALWTGARLEEIGQLLADDIKQENGVYFFHITDGTDTPEAGKNIKTDSSRRRVPIHAELVCCGFLEYLADIKKKGHARLFPLLSSGEGRQLTATFSQWFGRYLRGVVKVTDPRKVFHSFRHGFKDACRACGIPKEHHDVLTGHSSRDVGDGYGGESFPLAPLAGSMAQLRYEGLDLSHLHRKPKAPRKA